MANLDLTLSAVIRSDFLHQREATEQSLLKKAYLYTDLNVFSLLFDVYKNLIVFSLFMCFSVPGFYLKLKLFWDGYVRCSDLIWKDPRSLKVVCVTYSTVTLVRMLVT